MSNGARRGAWIGVVLGLGVILGLGVTTWYFYHQAQALRQQAGQGTSVEASRLKTEVGRLIVLPENELPMIATVSDLNALKDQLFFAHAHIGDKVLIFAQAKKAILYRPMIHKIVDVGPVSINDNSLTPSSKR